MKTILSTFSTAAVLLSASSLFNVANASLIFSEDFSGGSSSLVNSADASWTDTSGKGFEVYSVNGAKVRSMSKTYDHDNDASTAEIKIPGGIEVNDDLGNETLSVTFTLDSIVDAGQEFLLTFFAGERGNASGATVEVYNVTQDISLSGILEPVLGAGEWIFNSFSFDAATTTSGDDIQISWTGGGKNSAISQEVADVNLSIVDVPAPATAAIFALGLLGFGFSRFKK
ncbi:PEP-CTERM sorting domain-containing protein [Psychromonas arctica]|uniref:PEP-CTERM sorting domain-containing protein n=1 Tax=Psychromonas arctica TaxID=168275 RepID=UPI002FCE81BC